MVAELAAQFFPAADNGTPISLVVPQWEYNLSYIGLGRLLRHIAKRHVLDPTARLPARTPEELLQELWTRWLNPAHGRKPQVVAGLGERVPLQVAILSFASLDTDDALLYPLLAHELGHFIDFSFESPVHLRIVRGSANTTRDEIEVLVKAANLHMPDREVDKVWHWVTQMIRSCVTELLADCLATRMLGVSFFAALAEFLKTIAPWSEPRVRENGYPGITVRLAASLQQLRRGTEGGLAMFLTSTKGAHKTECEWLEAYLEAWDRQLGDTLKPRDVDATEPLSEQLACFVERKVLHALDDIEREASVLIPDGKCISLTSRFFERMDRLRCDLPPVCHNDSEHSFAEVLAAAWCYQLMYGEPREHERDLFDRTNRTPRKFLGLDEYNKVCRLVLKAIELLPSIRAYSEGDDGVPPPAEPIVAETARGVLDKGEICARMRSGMDAATHLGVIPSRIKAVQSASLDVHLGHWFSVARKTRFASVHLGKPKEVALLRSVGRELVFVPDGKDFIIHPGDFVLGATLEFVALPSDLMGFVEGKSSIGRLGLLVATATQIAPGFHGMVVLELPIQEQCHSWWSPECQSLNWCCSEWCHLSPTRRCTKADIIARSGREAPYTGKTRSKSKE